MFILTRETLLAAVTKMRRSVCAYGPNAQECDCKYGASAVGHLSTGSEETGCPELRSIELLLKGMSDHEYYEAMNCEPSPYDELYQQCISKWGTRAQLDIALEAIHEAEHLVDVHEQGLDEQVWIGHRRRFEDLVGLILDDVRPEESTWSSEQPTAPGFYWFYGKMSPKCPDRLHYVEAQYIWDGKLAFFVAHGSVITDLASGKWQPVTLPKTPEADHA